MATNSGGLPEIVYYIDVTFTKQARRITGAPQLFFIVSDAKVADSWSGLLTLSDNAESAVVKTITREEAARFPRLQTESMLIHVVDGLLKRQKEVAEFNLTWLSQLKAQISSAPVSGA